MKNKSRRLAALAGALILVASLIIPQLGTFAYANTGSDTKTWNFRGGQDGAFAGNLQGTGATDEWDGLLLDGTKGKIAARNGDTQINAEAKISVPVSGNAEVTVVSYPNYHNYTVNGQAADADTFTYTYTGEAGYVDIVFTAQSYIHEISVTSIEAEEPSGSDDIENGDLTVYEGNIDVWDFGAAQLDTDEYNNLLTATVINETFYSQVDAGTTNVCVQSFTVGDFSFITSKTNNRLRTTNTELTRYDANINDVSALEEALTGCLYVNGTSNAGTFSMQLEAGDAVTMYAKFDNADDGLSFYLSDTEVASFAISTNGGVITFVAPEAGTYTIKNTNDTGKLRLYRVVREHQSVVTVTGNIDLPSNITAGMQVIFTNAATGKKYAATVDGNTYSVKLPSNSRVSDYSISLNNADTFVISSEVTAFEAGTKDQTIDITVEEVPMATVTGVITGLTQQELASLQLNFTNVVEHPYKPVASINSTTGAYTVMLAQGHTYAITAENVNDYSMSVDSITVPTTGTELSITMTKKPVYDVTMVYDGLSTEEAASAVVTFTNLNEEGYSYTFTGTEGIQLRDGTYSVSVESAKTQKLTSNLTVEGAAVTKTVSFEDLTSWSFSDAAFTSDACLAGSFKGLGLTDITMNKNMYALTKAGSTITVPVSGECNVTVSYCYEAQGNINGETAFATVSHNTGVIETATYHYTGEAGVVTISFTGVSYVTAIEATPIVNYKETLTVGSTGCDFTTVGEAVAAAEAMDRIDENGNVKRVTISIMPGNYEEMVVVSGDNISLVNASETPSTDLTNAGVDIAENAVRITSYYGHGCYYYSQGSDGKYSEEVLAVNKENGYLSYNNPGAGTTNGSYWNATVVISGAGFEASGIIFENSFNQYVSEKEAADVIVLASDNKGGERSKVVGDTSVQAKSYVERAAAFALTGTADQANLENCRFVGRQDTLYGASGIEAVFDRCQIMGGTDYIFGGMSALFYDCDLVLNTSDDKNDVAYITASQTPAGGRGYLMYECNIVSTTPGVDTASTYTSKPGYLGRPWSANTGEAVFYNTTIGTTTYTASGEVDTAISLIAAAGWGSGLGGESVRSVEYGTTELSGEDNSANRASWASTITTPIIDNGGEGTTEITMEAFISADWLNVLKANGQLTEYVEPPVVEEPTTEEPTTEEPTTGDETQTGENVTTPSTENGSGEVGADESDITTGSEENTQNAAQGEVAADETQTGDSTRVGLYAMLLCLAGVMAMALYFFDKKRKAMLGR